MNARNDIEEKLKKIRCVVPSQADEQILYDAMAEFERASKVHIGRSRLIIAIAAAAVIILIAAAIILTMSPRQPDQQQKITEQTTTIQPLPVEKPEQPQTQPVPKTARTNKKAAADSQPKLTNISSLAARGDIDGLATILKTGDFSDKMEAVKFLSKMSDERAETALDSLAEKLDPNEPQDHLLAEALGIEDFGLLEEEIEDLEAEAEIETATEPDTRKPEKKQPAEKYVTGWLIDIDGYTLEGKIQVGKTNTATDANGAFSFKQPDFREFTSYIGYAAGTDGNMGTFFHWYWDDDFNNMEIMCLPFASAGGSVIDVNTQPVNDVHIKIVPEVNEQSTNVPDNLKTPWQIRTEADGSFEITSIPTGCPLVLILSNNDLRGQIPLGKPETSDHITLGQITLEAALEEDFTDLGG